jgi:ABC-type sugar transport system ATPase subunit
MLPIRHCQHGDTIMRERRRARRSFTHQASLRRCVSTTMASTPIAMPALILLWNPTTVGPAERRLVAECLDAIHWPLLAGLRPHRFALERGSGVGIVALEGAGRTWIKIEVLLAPRRNRSRSSS